MEETSVDQGGKLKKVETPVAEIYYLENGPADGTPMLLLHGFPDNPGGFDSVVTHLMDRGWRVIRPYLRGFGPTRVHEPAADGYGATYRHVLVGEFFARHIAGRIDRSTAFADHDLLDPFIPDLLQVVH